MTCSCAGRKARNKKNERVSRLRRQLSDAIFPTVVDCPGTHSHPWSLTPDTLATYNSVCRGDGDDCTGKVVKRKTIFSSTVLFRFLSTSSPPKQRRLFSTPQSVLTETAELRKPVWTRCHCGWIARYADPPGNRTALDASERSNLLSRTRWLWKKHFRCSASQRPLQVFLSGALESGMIFVTGGMCNSPLAHARTQLSMPRSPAAGQKLVGCSFFHRQSRSTTHGRFVQFVHVQSKASASSAPARVQSIIKHVHVTGFVYKRMLRVIAQPRLPAVLLCQDVSRTMATGIDKLASAVDSWLSLAGEACAVQRWRSHGVRWWHTGQLWARKKVCNGLLDRAASRSFNGERRCLG